MCAGGEPGALNFGVVVVFVVFHVVLSGAVAPFNLTSGVFNNVVCALIKRSYKQRLDGGLNVYRATNIGIVVYAPNDFVHDVFVSFMAFRRDANKLFRWHVCDFSMVCVNIPISLQIFFQKGSFYDEFGRN